MLTVFRLGFALIVVVIAFNPALADDWPMFGRDHTHNAVSPEKNPPLAWKIEQRDDHDKLLQSAENIEWTAKLGTSSIGDPVVSGGLVWVGSNNDNLDLADQRDASVLQCFRESDGKLLYKYVSPRLEQARYNDWPNSCLSCSPLIEGDRLWFTTNRCETVCLDIGPLLHGDGEPRTVWKVDMMHELGVYPKGSVMHFVRLSSVAGYKNWVYVITGNGTDETNIRIPKPNAPSLVCFDKNTGKLIWQDNSPGENILHGQWASPLAMEIEGQGQVIAPLGDGWLRSFDPATGKLLWEFDMNFKESIWYFSGTSPKNHRNSLLAAPVFYDNHIFLGTGMHPEQGGRDARLCCIDPTRRGDISSELAVDTAGQPLPHRRNQAVDKTKGEQAIPNPNSGLVWEFTKTGKEYENAIHGLVSQVAIANGLLIAMDQCGFVHCLDAKTGRRHWVCDIESGSIGSPLIVDGTLYVTDEDDNANLFRLSAEPPVAMQKTGDQWSPLAKMDVGESVNSSLIFANGVLYVATVHHLLAIRSATGQTGAVPRLEPREMKTPEPKRPTDAAETDRPPRSIFTATPRDVVEGMLEFAKVKQSDVVYDLGSGDGRILITAARKYGCRAIGYEIDRDLVVQSRKKVTQEKVEKLVTIEQKDLFIANLQDANVVALYLVPEQMQKLLPQLEKLPAGARIVSHQFEFPGIKPEKSITIESKDDGEKHTVYLWTAPLTKDKDAAK